MHRRLGGRWRQVSKMRQVLFIQAASRQHRMHLSQGVIHRPGRLPLSVFLKYMELLQVCGPKLNRVYPRFFTRRMPGYAQCPFEDAKWRGEGLRSNGSGTSGRTSGGKVPRRGEDGGERRRGEAFPFARSGKGICMQWKGGGARGLPGTRV